MARGPALATRVDLKDYGNVETRLAARRQAELLKEDHTSLLHDMLGDLERRESKSFPTPPALSLRCASRVWKWLASRANWRRASILALRAAFAGWMNRATMSSEIFSRRCEGFGARAAPTLSTNFTGFSPSAGWKACSSRTSPDLIRRFHPSTFIRRFRRSRGPIAASLTFSPRRAGDGWRWWN